MKIVWEWQFGFIEAAMLEMNHSLRTPRYNSVFSKGVSTVVVRGKGATLWKALSSFTPSPWKTQENTTALAIVGVSH